MGSVFDGADLGPEIAGATAKVKRDVSTAMLTGV